MLAITDANGGGEEVISFTDGCKSNLGYIDNHLADPSMAQRVKALVEEEMKLGKRREKTKQKKKINKSFMTPLLASELERQRQEKPMEKVEFTAAAGGGAAPKAINASIQSTNLQLLHRYSVPYWKLYLKDLQGMKEQSEGRRDGVSSEVALYIAS